MRRKFCSRLQQQMVVLLRRCHSVFPYFQTQSRKRKQHELCQALEELQRLGFDTTSYADEDIYSTHSRWIETDDMMHGNPLSLFSLLPDHFVVLYAHDLTDSDAAVFLMSHELSFAATPHTKFNLGDVQRRVRRREEALRRMASRLQAMRQEIRCYLKGERQIHPHLPAAADAKLFSARRTMPQRCTTHHVYVAVKAVYDALFKSKGEIGRVVPSKLRPGLLRVHALFAYDETKDREREREREAKGGKRKGKRDKRGQGQQQGQYYHLSSVENQGRLSGCWCSWTWTDWAATRRCCAGNLEAMALEGLEEGSDNDKELEEKDEAKSKGSKGKSKRSRKGKRDKGAANHCTSRRH